MENEHRLPMPKQRSDNNPLSIISQLARKTRKLTALKNTMPIKQLSPSRRSHLLTACTCCKNEAPYLLEWVAHAKSIGITNTVIYDNDSTDQSDALLKALTAEGLCKSVPWPSLGTFSPQISAFRHACTTLASETEFIIFIDLDEFLISTGDMTIHDFLRSLGPDVGAIAINQRVFGSSGKIKWEDGLVTERFQRANEPTNPENEFFKSIVRPEYVRTFNDPHFAELEFGFYVDTNGNKLKQHGSHPGRSQGILHDRFRINHYMLKSREEFEFKRRRGGGAAHELSNRIKRFSDGYFEGRDALCNKAETPESKLTYEAIKNVTKHIVEDAHAMSKAEFSDVEYSELLNIRYNKDIDYETIIEEIYSQLLFNGCVAIDGGAHLARHTIPMAKLVGAKGEVAAIEAIPAFIEIIRSQKKGHGLNNIRLLNCALSSSTSESDFFWVKNSAGYSSLERRELPFAADIEKITVRNERLDNIPFDRPIRFMKLDLEGGEYNALLGGRQTIARHKPIIVLENHGDETANQYRYSKEDWFLFFEGLNYSLIDLFGRMFDRNAWGKSNVPPYCVAYDKEYASTREVVKKACRKVLTMLHSERT